LNQLSKAFKISILVFARLSFALLFFYNEGRIEHEQVKNFFTNNIPNYDISDDKNYALIVNCEKPDHSAPFSTI
ncbi:MAG: hypothetical protein ACP5VS_01935, partial [Desulfomonilaceae bacterium]